MIDSSNNSLCDRNRNYSVPVDPLTSGEVIQPMASLFGKLRSQVEAVDSTCLQGVLLLEIIVWSLDILTTLELEVLDIVQGLSVQERSRTVGVGESSFNWEEVERCNSVDYHELQYHQW